jgi:hypothetical protein
MALALAGCATDAPRRADAGKAAPPMEVSDRMETQAMAFESFMRNASAIDPAFSSAGEVSRALQVGASHEPRQFEAGMVAYAAMAALQEPGFVSAVKRAGRGGELARRIAADPSAALELPGGRAAAGRASAALSRQAEALNASGQRVKKAAYSVQRQSWSKAKVANPSGRLAQVKRISAAAHRPESGDAAHLREAVASGGRGAGSASPLVTRAVALAALSALGDEARGRALTASDPRTGSCLRLAKLNLYQCLASAGPQYEDIYCLGQHAMMETSRCVADATRTPARRTPVTKASWTR